MQKKIACVGAGFSGAVIARELANSGCKVDVFESRDHVAGNCHTVRDEDTGILHHVYGPHIFHTNNVEVWEYVQKFDRFLPFVNRVKARANGTVYSLPINLHTINQLFNKQFSPKEAEDFISSISRSDIIEPISFEEQALKFVGEKIYETFFKGYTKKQWGVDPSRLPASILKRLPIRFNYDDNYYNSRFQGFPEHGYTFLVEQILNHRNIHTSISTSFSRDMTADYDHVFYSGPIDSWFNHEAGHLGYRTLKFELIRSSGDFQGNPVVNYCDESIPWTRITEHKHFTPHETHYKTLVSKEFSSLCGVNDIPYYPIRLVDDKRMLEHYVKLANAERGVTFVGRLGTYRYLDMHVTISEALKASAVFLQSCESGGVMPSIVATDLT